MGAVHSQNASARRFLPPLAGEGQDGGGAFAKRIGDMPRGGFLENHAPTSILPRKRGRKFNPDRHDGDSIAIGT